MQHKKQWQLSPSSPFFYSNAKGCDHLLLFVLLQCKEEGDGSKAIIAFFFLFCCSITKNATVTTLMSPFFFGCNEEGDGNKVTIAFFYCSVAKNVTAITLLSPFFVATKEATTTSPSFYFDAT
jgi:hypothetical protein